MADSNKMETLMKALAGYFGEENKDQVSHFQSVWLFAKTIAAEEGLDEETRERIEIAAVVHDITCPLCMKKYGSSAGNLQEKESYPMVKAFLSAFDLDAKLVERVAYMASVHHTYTDIDGIDLQVLIEADALVNLSSKEEIDIPKAIWFGANVFQTKTGKFLLEKLVAQAELEAEAEAEAQTEA